MTELGPRQGPTSLVERGARIWHRLRHSTIVGNALALYVVQFSGYLLPLITVPYTVRVLTASGYGLGAFAQSFAGFFGTIADYGFSYTATRAISINRGDRQAIARIVSDVMCAKAMMILACALVFWGLTLTVPQLRGAKLVQWMAFLGVAATTFAPGWLFQGLEKLRISSMVNLGARFAYLPALILFVRKPQDTWKWVMLVGMTSLATAAISWHIARTRLRVGFAKPTWAGFTSQMREGFSLFVSQAAVTLYTTGNVAILGFLTNMTVAGYYSAAERLIRTAVNLMGPITQSVYPRAAQLASSSRAAALRLTRHVLVVLTGMGSALALGFIAIAPWLCPILFGHKFLPSVSILQILSPLPLLIAVNNVMGIQVMIPFKHDRAVMLILVSAGLFNVGLGALLSLRWQGNGMALSVTLSEVLVAVAMFLHLARHGLLPWGKTRPEVEFTGAS